METRRLRSKGNSLLNAEDTSIGDRLQHQSNSLHAGGHCASGSAVDNAANASASEYTVYIDTPFDLSDSKPVSMLKSEEAGCTCLTPPSSSKGFHEDSDFAISDTSDTDSSGTLSMSEVKVEKPGTRDHSGEDSSSHQQNEDVTAVPACLQTPTEQGAPKTPQSKKRKARPEFWQRNVRKVKRLHGKEYISQSGNVISAKQMRPVDCSNCRMKCDRIKDRREEIFAYFYALSSNEKKKQFVCSHVHQKKTRTYLNEDDEICAKKRIVFREFSFTVDGKREIVCKKFFMSTLRVSNSYLDHALEHCHNGVYLGKAMPRHRPHNKTADSITAKVKEHISSFPVMLPHHSQSGTQREYLPADLSVKKMYKLYSQQCQEEGSQPVRSKHYRDVFRQTFNLSFHAPMRDQCSICIKHSKEQAQDCVDEAGETSYQEHLRRKDKAYEEKEADKQAASLDSSKHVATVDLQAVLPVPSGLGNELYDKRKLFVHNCTVFSLADFKSTCYVWDETEGLQGSCEIASCLSLYLSSLPSVVKEVTIYCECSWEKNLNQSLIAALLHASKSVPNIEVITLKYFEVGHTQTDCDPMHSAISFAKQNAPIYTPDGWRVALGMSRKGKKYTIKVVPLKHSSFFDFKKVAASSVLYTETDIRRRPINWLQVCCVQVLKHQEDLLLFKTSFEESEFRVLRLMKSSERSLPAPLKTLPCLYSDPLPISTAKKQDLLSLCAEGIIPEEHHVFFHGLPTHPSAVDRLPQPDRNERVTTADSDME